MIAIELANLVKRLSPELKVSLEQAAGECVQRHHDTVMPAHWFYVLLKNGQPRWQNALNMVGINRQQQLDLIEKTLVQYSRNISTTPTLSNEIIEILKSAWLQVSLNQLQTEINEYHLLIALREDSLLSLSCEGLCSWIKKLSGEWLITQSIQTGCNRGVANLSDIEKKRGALSKFGRNLSELARQHKLDPVTGRNNEIHQVMDILCRRRQNSPILVGEAGVGKTAIVEGLAQRIAIGDVPDILVGIELWELDLTSLQAGASLKGEFENRLKDILTEIKQSSVPMIIFIDEAHSLIGAGGAQGQNDAANILKPALARGEIRSIAATTWSEYKQYFESDPALSRRFQKVIVSQPSSEEAEQILRNLQPALEKHHGVRILQSALRAAVALSVRYLPERQLPDKAISLLDTACARLRLAQTLAPAELEILVEQIESHKKELMLYCAEEIWGGDISQHTERLNKELRQLEKKLSLINDSWNKEKTLIDTIMDLQEQIITLSPQDDELAELKIALQQKKLKLNQIQGDTPLISSEVNAQTIAEIIARWTGIPSGDLLREEIDVLMQLEERIAQRVIGQKAPINAIAQSLRIARTGLNNIQQPIGVFLMCGPRGVGKTETALALSQILYASDQSLTVLNMTEFKEPHKVSQLLGAPAGYVGYGKGGILTEAIRKKPYTVLLLDEIEKAHPSVHDIFYQIFDKGIISDSEGREISFRNTIIIMTTNAADSEIVDYCSQAEVSIEKLTQHIFPTLLRYFKPAFLGRTSIIPYYPLSDEELYKIATLSLARIESRIKKQYDATFEYADEVIDYLLSKNTSPETGARAIEQIIQRSILPQLAEECIKSLTNKNKINKVKLLFEDERIKVFIN